MMDAEPKCVSVFMPATPVFHDKTQRRSAFVQAAVFEPSELKTAGQQQRARSNDPAIVLEPRASFYSLMQYPIG
jgi:hypothetical protein